MRNGLKLGEMAHPARLTEGASGQGAYLVCDRLLPRPYLRPVCNKDAGDRHAELEAGGRADARLAVSTCAMLTTPHASNRILGRSATGWGTLQGKEGDVVLLLPSLPNEGVELLQEEAPQ